MIFAPAYRAPLANWTERTSLMVMVTSRPMEVSFAQPTTNSAPSSPFRTRSVSCSLTNLPVLSMMPALEISATPSMMPDPHMPLVPMVSGSISSDHSSLPMTLYRGSLLSVLMQIRSIAPDDDRMPKLI